MRRERPPFECPREAAADKRPPSRTSGLQAHQGAAHCALPRISVGGSSSSAPPAGGTAASDFRLEARIKGRRYARAQSAGTSTVSASPPSVSRWGPRCSAGKSAALGASLRGGPAPPVVWQDEPATPLPAPFLRGTASPCHHLPAIPPHLRREESRRKCSGQAGHSRPHPLPAVGADSVSHRRSALRHSPPPSSCAACHRLRRGHSARPDGREPSTFGPGMGRSVPDPGGSLPTHNVGLFRCSREPCVSLPRRSRARRPSRCQTPSGATLHCVPRPWSLGDSKPGCRPDGIKNGNDITRITDPP